VVKVDPAADEAGLEASGAEQDLARDWKPERDPWSEKRKPRVARAKVSAVSKGVIPTTLGGKLPPVSVLARREFGLRALRR
jgi:hypothetical protein